jgi:hypothetical protein
MRKRNEPNYFDKKENTERVEIETMTKIFLDEE